MDKVSSHPGPSFNQPCESYSSSKTVFPSLSTGQLRSESCSFTEIKSIDERMVSKLSSTSIDGLMDTDIGVQTYKKLLDFFQDSKKIKSTDDLFKGDISFNECFNNNSIRKLAKLLTFNETVHIALSNNIHQLSRHTVQYITARLSGDVPDTANSILHAIREMASSNASLLDFMLSLQNHESVNNQKTDRV